MGKRLVYYAVMLFVLQMGFGVFGTNIREQRDGAKERIQQRAEQRTAQATQPTAEGAAARAPRQ